jgi:hypothetical protein
MFIICLKQICYDLIGLTDKVVVVPLCHTFNGLRRAMLAQCDKIKGGRKKLNAKG